MRLGDASLLRVITDNINVSIKAMYGSSIALIGTMRKDGKKGLNREMMSKKVNGDV